MMLHRWRRMVTVGVALLGGCGDSTDSEPFGDVAGYYVSTTFIVTPTGGSAEDVLAAGGLLTIGLEPNGTVTGTLILFGDWTWTAPIVPGRLVRISGPDRPMASPISVR